jgi:hypothetical protein
VGYRLVKCSNRSVPSVIGWLSKKIAIDAEYAERIFVTIVLWIILVCIKMVIECDIKVCLNS